MKYIGPFLRMNSLNSETIEKQLFFLAKESVKYLVLHSKCGITLHTNELKVRNTPNFDNSILSSLSPLLCVYKKGNAKLLSIGGNLSFDEDSLKREITIESNAFMTLSLLELVDYYKKFKDIDNKKYSLSTLYLSIARKQLEFFAANLRNIEGVFVDKKHGSKDSSEDNKFEEKNKKFRYSDQALLMAAYYKYSLFDEGKYGEDYKNFALDILKMFLEFRDELYRCSNEDLLKLSLAFNLLYRYSGLDDAKLIMLDLGELLIDSSQEQSEDIREDTSDYDGLLYINLMLLYSSTGILKFKDKAEEIYSRLLELYQPERGIFIKLTDKKEIEYTCMDIVLYLLSVLSHMNIFEKTKDGNLVAVDIFKRQLVDSGIILSWPASPDLDDIERYRGFSSKAEDLLEEQDFRMASVPTPDSVELPPIFIKYVNYNKKKETFSQSKFTFDSTKNMLLFFLILHLGKLFDEKDLSPNI
ncbi:hypothetical protein NBE98_20485 [Clostridium swellfunianum]|uniref:hypothetical protein n=1 Tax=Clostridium swellfunianum TaxID=1367462 RepID=UPI00202F11CA|nr:hypothetical protein [Clostridium swellfunianum]MCM0650735.1 hypothetical protein [Clostridium swellfunianum]